tara:strand:+ start:1095 stop:2033 length:939 start_codon:yes stop_codon:yes gene_type:complete
MTKLNGPVFSIVTPFSDEGRIDYKQLFKYLDHAYSLGARQFYSMAYNSRYSQLRHDEILVLNTAIIKHLKKTDPNCIVIVGDPIACPTSESKEAARLYSDLGSDMVSILFSERYYSDDQVLEHYASIAEGLGCGMLIHEMPLQSGLGGPEIMWPTKLISRLLKINEIEAIKEDAKDNEYTKEIAKIAKGKADILLSGGGKRRWMEFGSELCPSWLNGLGVAFPSYPIKFWNLYTSGKIYECNLLLSKIEPLFFDECVNKYGWHLCIRVALHMQGFSKLIERKPLNVLKGEEYNEVCNHIKNIQRLFKEMEIY